MRPWESACRDRREQRGGGTPQETLCAPKVKRRPLARPALVGPEAVGTYGVVVESVNVSVLLYAPVRSASLAPIDCLNSSVTPSLLIGPE